MRSKSLSARNNTMSIYVMPSGKFPTQDGKPVLITQAEFEDCCCEESKPWRCYRERVWYNFQPGYCFQGAPNVDRYICTLFNYPEGCNQIGGGGNYAQHFELQGVYATEAECEENCGV